MSKQKGSMMKAEHEFMCEQADKVFQVVAKTFASGGGNENATMQIKEILYDVSVYSRKCTISETLQKLKDFTERIGSESR